MSHALDNKCLKQMNILKRGPIAKIPQVIDDNHVSVISPDSKLDCYCRKQMYLINTQTIAGGSPLVFDVVTRLSGSMHNVRVLRHICQISGDECIDDDRLLN